MVFRKIWVARVKTGSQPVIVSNYYNNLKKKVGHVCSFPNPSYIDPFSNKRIFILPWYLFVEVEEEINLMEWIKEENRIYYFVCSKEGIPYEVGLEDFANFIERSMEIIKLKGSEMLEGFEGKAVKIETGTFANYEGTVDSVKKDKIGVRLNSSVPVLIWVDRKDVTIR